MGRRIIHLKTHGAGQCVREKADEIAVLVSDKPRRQRKLVYL